MPRGGRNAPLAPPPPKWNPGNGLFVHNFDTCKKLSYQMLQSVARLKDKDKAGWVCGQVLVDPKPSQ